MDKKNNDFLKRLLATFKVEAEEHITAISSGLVEMEKASAAKRQMEIFESVFREAHSLKGAARAVNMTEIEATCQSLESVFAALKHKSIAPSPELFNILHKAVDTLNRLLLSAVAALPPVEKPWIRELNQQLESASKGKLSLPREDLKKTEEEIPIAPKPESYRPSVEGKPMLAETVRISTAKLDAILLQAEELLSSKPAANQHAAKLEEINVILAAWEKEWAKSGFGVSKNQQLNEFLTLNYNFFKSLEDKLTILAKSIENDSRSLGGMVDILLESMKKLLMVPVSLHMEIFPKLIRDLSHDQGKDVELVIKGGDIEIDRRILEEMKDPLIHLVRNCIDYGIEKPEERMRKNKPPRGTITIAISQKNSNKVEITISDDGAGINIDRVRAAALKLGIISQEDAEKLNEQKILPLIFQSGVSTSPIITDISGRGLGLAITEEKVQKLGGIVYCESNPDAGTTFQIVLPMTLAIFRGVSVRADEHIFILPTTNVDRTLRIKQDEIKTVEGKETISLNGRTIPLVPLHAVLELPQKEKMVKNNDFITVLVLGTAEKRIAFSADDVLNEEEVLVKSLGKQLSRVRNIAGATVLGTGKVIPILNVPDLMKSALKVAVASRRATIAEEEVKRKSILVAEDSITSRTLLKHILSAVGYNVTTAFDGVDAITLLKTNDFDLVVSDVDMPRMNGFDLTVKIRSEKKLADLPVVLVTALESRNDREHGIDVGANAYIVKSSFDQSNLLETIKRLI